MQKVVCAVSRKAGMNLLILFWLFLLVSACNPQRQLFRFLKKHPNLTLTDTTMIRDTIYIYGMQVDTVFAYYQKDTVIIKEGKITQRYFYNTTDSTVYIDCNCEPDTIIRQVPQYITRLAPPVQKGPRFWEWIGILLVMMILTFLGTTIYQSIKKKG